MKRVIVLDGEAAFLTAAYLRELVGDKAQVIYVASEGDALDVRVLNVLAEDGVDPYGPQEALVDLHMGEPCDVLITLSERARKRAPSIPCAYKLHCEFPYLSLRTGNDHDMELLYRLRNEVKFFAQKVADRLLRVLVA